MMTLLVRLKARPGEFDPPEYLYVKKQLAQARCALAPDELTALQDEIAAHFAPNDNLQFELERLCNLVADVSSEDNAAPRINKALARVESLLATLSGDREQWLTEVIPHLSQARLHLSEEVRERLATMSATTTPSSVHEQDGIDMAFFLHAFREASDARERIHTGREQGLSADIVPMVRNEGSRADLVQQEFVALAETVRREFTMLKGMQSAGAPFGPMANELHQLYALNRMLTEVTERPAGISAARFLTARGQLLNDTEQQRIQTWLAAAELREDANEVGSIDRQVKDVRQLRLNACGDACVQALLEYHELQSQDFGSNDRWWFNGATVDELRQQLEQHGIGSMYLVPEGFRRASASDLRQWLTHHGPLLAGSKDHAFLITGIEGDRVRIHCPLLGAREASVDDLNRYVDWSVTPSPLQATYKLGTGTASTTHRTPGPLMRFMTRRLAGLERKDTPAWQAVGTRPGAARQPRSDG